MPIRTLIVLTLVACAASGCGRRGSLEDPAAPQETLAPAEQVGATPFGDLLPVEEELQEPPPPGPQRRFPLDFLL